MDILSDSNESAIKKSNKLTLIQLQLAKLLKCYYDNYTNKLFGVFWYSRKQESVGLWLSRDKPHACYMKPLFGSPKIYSEMRTDPDFEPGLWDDCELVGLGVWDHSEFIN